MKKRLLALLSLLLVAVMMLSLAACGDTKKDAGDETVSDTGAKGEEETDTEKNGDSTVEPSDEPVQNGSADAKTIVGTWQAEIPFADLVKITGMEILSSDAVMAVYGEAVDGCTLTASFTVEDNGVATLSYRDFNARDEFMAAVDAYMRNDGIYKYYEAQDVSREELDGIAAAEGMTMDEFIDVVVGVINSESEITFVFNEIEATDDMTDTCELDGKEGTFGEFVIELDGSTLNMTKDDVTMEFKKQ